MDDDIAQQELEIVNNFVLGLRALGELIVSGLKVASAFLQDLLVTPWTFADNTADTQGSSAAANNRPSDARTATQGIKGRSSNTAPDRQEEEQELEEDATQISSDYENIGDIQTAILPPARVSRG